MKIKNMKRTVVTTALALTLTAGLTIPTQAAPRRLNTEEFKTCLQVSTNCKAPWLQTLLDCLGGQKPETPDTPVLPDTPTEPISSLSARMTITVFSVLSASRSAVSAG